MYGPRLPSHVRPQTPVTYEWDNCRANTPTDKDKNSCQYAYEYDPVAGIILPPKRPRRWYRTTVGFTRYYITWLVVVNLLPQPPTQIVRSIT